MKLNFKEGFYIGLFIFGMFFGAGNLIFPPFLGKEAGSNLFVAMLFFSISAIIFPMLGVIVATKSNGLSNITNKAGKLFTLTFLTLTCIAIGPALAIPRSASLPFDMVLKDLISNDLVIYLRLIYTILFFILVYYLSLNPSKLLNKIAKILTPSLLILILLMFFSVILKVDKQILAPVGDYIKIPAVKGFIEGYNTMDALASLNIGLVISLTIEKNYDEEKEKRFNYIVKGTIIATILLFIVYYILAYIGASSSYLFKETTNGALILKEVMKYGYGNLGLLILSVIFGLACITISISLSTFVTNYISNEYKFISYINWLRIITIISFILSNFGLDNILKFSVPLLLFLYPIILVMIILEILDYLIKLDKVTYKIVSYTIVLVSLLLSLKLDILKLIPFNEYNLGWLVPILITFVISYFSNKVINKLYKVK